MITRLYLDNCFKHRDVTFTFEKGLTAITGRNEAGKSLIAEMIRYALFGSAALRGTAEDYKKLHVELDFVVRGEPHSVVRKGSKAVLTGPVGEIATGTREVNEAIRNLFGYTLKVFDVANACNQGAVEVLSDMKPAERKRMIDQTVGLEVFDALMARVSERLGGARKGLSILEGSVSQDPGEPPVYTVQTPAAELRQQFEKLQEDVSTLNHLRGWLSHRPPALGPQPEETEKRSLTELEGLHNLRQSLLTKTFNLRNQIAHAVEPSHTSEQLDAIEVQIKAHRAWTKFQREYPRTEFTSEQLDQFEVDLEVLQTIAEYNRLSEWLERLRSEVVLCQHCGEETYADPEKVSDIERTRDAYFVPEPHPVVPIDGYEIQRQRALIRAWENAPEPVEAPELDEADVADHRRRLLNWQKVEEWKHELALIEAETPESVTEAIAERKVFETRVKAWLADKAKIEVFERAYAENRARHDALVGCEEKRDEVVGQLNTRLDEEKALARYLDAKARYEADAAKLADLKDEIENLDKVRGVLTALRQKIKNLLIPSLERVASHLLSNMTGGERTLVSIDEDFEIRIDGQPIGTLSGSGKAVSNLALRIALGQVLTNRVFSLFLADEIDAAMDDERARWTAECLRRLTSVVEQIILITHKNPTADHKYELSK